MCQNWAKRGKEGKEEKTKSILKTTHGVLNLWEVPLILANELGKARDQ